MPGSATGEQRHKAAASCLALQKMQGAALRPEPRNPDMIVTFMSIIDLVPASARPDWRESLARCYSQPQLLNLSYDSPVMAGARLLLPEGGSGS